jgi:hypothetical protein
MTIAIAAATAKRRGFAARLKNSVFSLQYVVFAGALLGFRGA